MVGIVGCAENSLITNCTNNGQIYGSSHVGVAYQSSKIYNCYNATTNISGTSYIGNAVGEARQIYGNYNSWLDGETPVGYSSAYTCGTNSAYSLAQMKQENSALLTLLSNEEGNNIWAQDANINNGLPYLKYNMP